MCQTGSQPTLTCRCGLFGFRAERGQGDGREMDDITDNSFFIIASVLNYLGFDWICPALSFFTQSFKFIYYAQISFFFFFRFSFSRKVMIMEDPDQNIHLRNLSLQQSSNEEEALNLLFLGDTNRMIAEVRKRETHVSVGILH